jgi:hypothetical protein
VEINIQRGEPPSWIKSYGDGSGDGSGDGYGYGYGDGDGYGDGSGYGSSDGSGDGSGYGYGYGDGYGSGYGSGYGYGDGCGDGYGDGSGSGSGYGDGYGYGYGYGYGDGSGCGYGDGYGSFWRSTIACFAEKWTAKQQKRLKELEALGATIAFWRSDQKGMPANGGRSIEAVYPGLVQTIPGPLKLCYNAFHATLDPPKWNGERYWIVALIGEVTGNEEKYGALTREIIGEAL